MACWWGGQLQGPRMATSPASSHSSAGRASSTSQGKWSYKNHLILCFLVFKGFPHHQTATGGRGVGRACTHLHGPSVLVMVPYYFDKTSWQKAAWGGIILPYHVQFTTQDRTLEAGAGAEAMEGCCLLLCISWLAQPVFLYSQGLFAQVWHDLQWAGCPPSIID